MTGKNAIIGDPSLIWKTPSYIINVVNPNDAINDKCSYTKKMDYFYSVRKMKV